MGRRFIYIPNRVIDTNGISDGASIYVYQTGTTTLVSLYSDESLTTPISNPYVVTAGAPVPEIYHGYSGNIRVKVVASGGEVVSDDDPYQAPVTDIDLASTDTGKGAGLVRFQDGSTVQDLAATEESKGAALVAKGQTTLAKIAPVTPYEKGAVGDGVSDDSDAVEAAAQGAVDEGKVLDLLTGTFLVTRELTVTVPAGGSFRVINSGGAKILAQGFTSGTYVINVVGGSVTQISDLSASPSKGATQITTATATGLAAGDLACIYNPADSSFSPWRTYYRAGEFVEILSAATTTLNLTNSLYAGYDHTVVDLYKVNWITGSIRDIDIEADGSMPGVIYIECPRNFKVDSPRIRHANNDCLTFNLGFNCTVTTPDIYNEGDGGNDYGVVWANCQNCFIIGGDLYSRRHPVNMGGGDQVCGVPCRNVFVRNATLRNDPASDTHCADMHGNVEACGYENNNIFGGCAPAGLGAIFRNNRMTSMAIGVIAYAGEVIGGVFEFTGNTMIVTADPHTQAQRGIIDFGGNSLALGANLQSAVTIVAENNRVQSTALTINSVFVYARNQGTAHKINLRVVGNTLDINEMLAVARARYTSGTAASDFLIVERNECALTGKYALFTDASYTALPVLRLPRQEWTGTATTSTSAATATVTAKTFKWVYPRTPVVQASALGGYVGSASPVPYVSAASTTAATIGIRTPDSANFSAVTGITVNGVAGISEV